MGFFTVMIRDIVIIGVVASFCEMVLPDSDVKHPVRLVFGLYFMALLLNPLITLWTDTDLSSIDFGIMAETETIEAQEIYEEQIVYAEAARTLETEIEGKLGAAYGDCSVSADIQMDESGFESVRVELNGNISSEMVASAEISDLLSRDYGIPKDVISVVLKKG